MIQAICIIIALVCALIAIQIELERTRRAIRLHRDQRLDDRCWMDDYALYEVLPEGLYGFVDIRSLPRAVMLENCARYVDCRLTQLTPEAALAEYRKGTKSIQTEHSWRVGSRVPINVYKGDRPICQCHNEIGRS